MTDDRTAGSAPSGAEHFRGNARYQVLRCLGGGAAGDVYEVFDRERGTRVALKTLRQVDGAALYRFKREFRALAGVDHPNLVSLYELFAESDEWFFTMEYVDGTDLLSYVRGAERSADGAAVAPTISEAASNAAAEGATPAPAIRGPDDCAEPLSSKSEYSRLLAALRQLVDGVHVLHDAGKLHRDIKPSNVLVDRSGRVVILDLGLVAEITKADPGSGIGENLAESDERGQIVGTPAYMAPEQAAGHDLGPPADWYGVGAILFEALTGRTPFVGGTIQIMSNKQLEQPPHPRELCSSIPRHLDELCVGLLAREPHRRLRGTEVLAQLGSSKQPSGLQTGITPVMWDSAQVLGRKQALAALHEAFSDRRPDGTAAVLVLAEPGMGKSSLLARFLEEAAVDEAPLVLQGRCFARESVPFRALDNLIDDLSRALGRVTRDHGVVMTLNQLTSLAQIFPVLWRVGEVASARRAAQADVSPQELRRRAFEAFRTLLRRLATYKPVILYIDDLQWGDEDSGELLAEALRPPHPPSLLFVGCCRGDGSESPLVKTLRERLRAHDAELAEFELEPLDEDDSRRLARALLGEDPRAVEFATAVSRESGGNPYFVNELARHVLGVLAQRDAAAEAGARDEQGLAPASIHGVRLE
ncbi:MAG: protein kinase, partial [Deltaproteobacteria bacterium]|nr:protein kinase [Deltaproteobacteria bacterium]